MPVTTDVKIGGSPFQLDTQGAIPIIASALVLDHYLPGQHDSDPGDVFRTVYRETCHRAYKTSLDTSETFDELFLPAGFVALLEHSVCRQFGRYLEVGATEAHRSLLAEARDYILNLHSEATCLVCLASRPQYALPCVHTICQACVWRFGSLGDSRSCYLSHCPLCDTQAELIVRKKPETASPRVLSLDGGGARGIASLAILEVLEEAIGLPCPIQLDHRQCALYQWLVGQGLLSAFESLSQTAFRPRPLLMGPLSTFFLPSSWWAFVNSLLFDGRYPAVNLESALKGVFGSERSILDSSAATERGVMVGMPIATNSSDTIIATNYNGVGRRNGNQGAVTAHTRHLASDKISDYTILHSDNGVRQIPLWELPGERLVYFAADCEFFRFDPEFDGPEPELDSVKDMGMVRETASQAALHAPTLPKLKQHVHAELFYFELTSLPSQNNGFLCHGQILCRFDAASSELDALVSRLAQKDATFAVKNHFIPIHPSNRAGSNSKSQFCKKIKFRVSSREEQFHIVLNEEHQATPISGSPFTLAQLVQVQQLDSWFGRTGCREMVQETGCGSTPEDETASEEPAQPRRANRRKRVIEVDLELEPVKYRRTSDGRRRRV
ncbi:hypothetical protein N3K66_009073 [Trichothecium roseum]|uniref:Uncharacterized protein n=1 Tax=Trichothecium roseum TaxID=47278 RepID=A0ACC0UR51_9HYPO|nr:hypothetical protein N3K66_009073 [Trichothecium roseum]